MATPFSTWREGPLSFSSNARPFHKGPRPKTLPHENLFWATVERTSPIHPPHPTFRAFTPPPLSLFRIPFSFLSLTTPHTRHTPLKTDRAWIILLQKWVSQECFCLRATRFLFFFVFVSRTLFVCRLPYSHDYRKSRGGTYCVPRLPYGQRGRQWWAGERSRGSTKMESFSAVVLDTPAALRLLPQRCRRNCLVIR